MCTFPTSRFAQRPPACLNVRFLFLSAQKKLRISFKSILGFQRIERGKEEDIEKFRMNKKTTTKIQNVVIDRRVHSAAL